jgi:hypothetical protein
VIVRHEMHYETKIIHPAQFTVGRNATRIYIGTIVERLINDNFISPHWPPTLDSLGSRCPSTDLVLLRCGGLGMFSSPLLSLNLLDFFELFLFLDQLAFFDLDGSPLTILGLSSL